MLKPDKGSTSKVHFTDIPDIHRCKTFKGLGARLQVAEYLSGKCEVLSSDPLKSKTKQSKMKQTKTLIKY
jgi:hypothetical protein